MEKSDRPVKESWFGKGETIDAELLVDLLETFRFGKANLPNGKIGSKEAETTPPQDDTDKMKNEEEDDGSQGNKSVHEITAWVPSDSELVLLENPMSESGSRNEPGPNSEPGSNEEAGDNWLELESSSTNLPNVENEMQRDEEDAEKEEEEEMQQNVEDAEKEEAKETQRNLEDAEKKEENNLEDAEKNEEEDEISEISSESDEKSNLEKLLATQENYELYCPSCSSCITREVILKVRRRENEVVESSDIVEIEPPVPKTQSDITESLPQNKPEDERFFIELLKSIVYGGLTETITSLGLVSSASASGSSTMNILALAVANLAGGLVILAQNLHDLRNNSDQEKDRYGELLGRRANIRIHILVAVLSYILFGLIPPLVYAFSFYQTGIKNYKLISVFLVSLVCVILLAMIKVYVRNSPNLRVSPKSYLKSAAYYTSIVLASCGASYVVGDYVGDYMRNLGLFSLDQSGTSSSFYGANPEDFRFSSFQRREWRDM